MQRPILVAVLAATQLVYGCAGHPCVLPAGQDPDELVAAIAERGQGGPGVDGAVEPDFPEASVASTCVKTAGKVCATGVALSLVLVLAAAWAAARGPHQAPSTTGIGDFLKSIWAD